MNHSSQLRLGFNNEAAETQCEHTLRLKSFRGEEWYTICFDHKTCDCPGYDGKGRGCEHLAALGIRRVRPFTPTTHPSFSQALSGLVKTIRLRRIEDAIYWLLYLDSFKEKQYRFRMARRLLIASAEDGHSIPMMETVVSRFQTACRLQTDLSHLVTDAVRICKLPNWWHSDSGGPDYIYQSLIGQRAWLYKRWDHSPETVYREIENAIANKNRANALGAVMALNESPQRVGTTRQAEFLLSLAESPRHELAQRLCKVHLSAKSALSGDNNFLCQAVWMMAGGVSPIAERMESVASDECNELLARAKERWRNPQPIPRWCCDGIHSAGDDARFAGLLPQMWAVCRAFQHYKRVNPQDQWLLEFQCLDGLVIEANTNSQTGTEDKKTQQTNHSGASLDSAKPQTQGLKEH